MLFFKFRLFMMLQAYLDIGYRYRDFYLSPSYEDLYSIGMVREPFFTSLLGVFALIFKDPDNIILANMVLCHCLFVLTVVRLSNSFDMSKMAVTISASVAILGFGLIDLIIVPMAEGWQMIFMGQLVFYLNLFFFFQKTIN